MTRWFTASGLPPKISMITWSPGSLDGEMRFWHRACCSSTSVSAVIPRCCCASVVGLIARHDEMAESSFTVAEYVESPTHGHHAPAQKSTTRATVCRKSLSFMAAGLDDPIGKYHPHRQPTGFLALLWIHWRPLGSGVTKRQRAIQKLKSSRLRLRSLHSTNVRLCALRPRS